MGWLGRNRWCWAENSGPCPAGGGRASAQCKEMGLAVSVWAELAATAVATWSPWGEWSRRGTRGFSCLPRRSYLTASRSSSAR